MLISVVHQMCTYALYVGTTLRSSDHHSHLNGAERRAETLTMMTWNREAKSFPRYAYVVHAFPFSAISEGNPCLARFSILKTTPASSAQFERARHAVWTVGCLLECNPTL